MTGSAVTTRTAGDGYRTTIDGPGFHLVADEPLALGGTGAGPTPYDLLLAALGACTGMTLRMYAARKGWPLESVEVTLREGRDHAADCRECERPDTRVTRLDRELHVRGPLDDEQRQRLVQIAEMCPVHKSLGASFQIRTTLRGDEHASVPPAE
jgi:putative redox protein